jgi:hypothetical protein
MDFGIKINDIEYEENFFGEGNCATFVKIYKYNALYFCILNYYLIQDNKLKFSLKFNENVKNNDDDVDNEIILEGKFTIYQILNLFKTYNISLYKTKNTIELNEYRKKLIDSNIKLESINFYIKSELPHAIMWFIHIGLSKEDFINEKNILLNMKDEKLENIKDLGLKEIILDTDEYTPQENKCKQLEEISLNINKLQCEYTHLSYLYYYLIVKLELFF